MTVILEITGASFKGSTETVTPAPGGPGQTGPFWQTEQNVHLSGSPVLGDPSYSVIVREMTNTAQGDNPGLFDMLDRTKTYKITVEEVTP